jgi:hypothetical protein
MCAAVSSPGVAEGIRGIERDEGRGLLTCGYYQTARVAYANCPCAVFGVWELQPTKQESPAQQPWEVGFTNRVVKSWGRAMPRCQGH